MATQDELKQMAADAALQEILPLLTPDAVIGVGTGSTADLFIDALASYKTQFLGAVASSERTASRLQKHGIKVLSLDEVTSLPVYVDGADEIDEQLVMIKGGGGALTREKIVASVAQRFICIADESKLVKQLGTFPLPVEVIPMAKESVSRYLLRLGGTVKERTGFITDNGNIILDVHNLMVSNPLEYEFNISAYPGIVTCGIFAQQAAHVALLAGEQGVKRLTR